MSNPYVEKIKDEGWQTLYFIVAMAGETVCICCFLFVTWVLLRASKAMESEMQNN